MVRIKVVVQPSNVAAAASPGARAVVASNAGGSARFGDVLVPLDGTPDAERAVPVASALAGALGAQLHLLTTIDDLPEQSPSAYLEQVAGRIEGVAETEVALDQDPVVTIADHAAVPGSVVCMATHARGRLSTALKPDVASAVVAAATAPVVLVGPKCVPGLGAGPVLVAHDGTPPCTDATLPLIELAAALGRPVEVVRVASAPSAVPNEHPYADTDSRVAPLLARASELGVEASEQIVFGTDVHDALLAEATRIGASMLALATHRRSRRERFVEGSTTIALAHDATVPVAAHHVES